MEPEQPKICGSLSSGYVFGFYRFIHFILLYTDFIVLLILKQQDHAFRSQVWPPQTSSCSESVVSVIKCPNAVIGTVVPLTAYTEI